MHFKTSFGTKAFVTLKKNYDVKETNALISLFLPMSWCFPCLSIGSYEAIAATSCPWPFSPSRFPRVQFPRQRYGGWDALRSSQMMQRSQNLLFGIPVLLIMGELAVEPRRMSMGGPTKRTQMEKSHWPTPRPGEEEALRKFRLFIVIGFLFF